MNVAFDTERNETRAQITEVCRSTCRTKLEQTQGFQGAAEKKKSRMETCARAIGQVSGKLLVIGSATNSKEEFGDGGGF